MLLFILSLFLCIFGTAIFILDQIRVKKKIINNPQLNHKTGEYEPYYVEVYEGTFREPIGLLAFFGAFFGGIASFAIYVVMNYPYLN